MRTKQKPKTPGAMLTVDQAWNRLGGSDVITRQAIYLAIGRGDLPSVRLGRRLLIPREPFEQWMTGGAAWRMSKENADEARAH